LGSAFCAREIADAKSKRRKSKRKRRAKHTRLGRRSDFDSERRENIVRLNMIREDMENLLSK
jgi:hypothetical protein